MQSDSPPPDISPDICITCRHVIQEGKDVNCVSHSAGGWVMLCGDNVHSTDDASDFVSIHVSHLLERDPDLKEIMSKLDIDYTAERADKSSAWEIYHDPVED